MDPATIGLIGAGVSAVGSLFGGERSNKANRKEAARNRSFQERMRNTQWQSTVSDMRAAGINPAVAYSSGPNAAPGGSMASQTDTLTPAISSAMQAKRLSKELGLLDSQIAKTKADEKKALMESKNVEARLAAYGITIDGKGRLHFDWDSNKLPRMTREIDAMIGLNQARMRREKLTGDTIVPISELAGSLGMLLPLLTGGGAMLPKLLQALKKPSKGLTIQNYVKGKGR